MKIDIMNASVNWQLILDILEALQLPQSLDIGFLSTLLPLKYSIHSMWDFKRTSMVPTVLGSGDNLSHYLFILVSCHRILLQVFLAAYKLW